MESAYQRQSDERSGRHEPAPEGRPLEHGLYIDPFIERQLKQHQKEGVQFMYDCILGHRGNFTGCILADSMGLGKTLQVLALVHSLRLRLPKTVIVAPSGLLHNWKLENEKFLHARKLPLQVCAGSHASQESALFEFINSTYAVLLISYGLFVKHLERVDSIIQLAVFDEGHKIKEKTTKLSRKLNDLTCKRRILLTGTPLQNNLEEFYNCAAFVAFEVMGERSTFMHRFEKQIMLSLELTNYDDTEKHKGLLRLEELRVRTGLFILRRTYENLDVLPPRYEYLLFCPLTDLQFMMYQEIVDVYVNRRQRSELNIGSAMTVASMLQKLMNHPYTLYEKLRKRPTIDPHLSRLFELLEDLPEGYEVESSSKFIVLNILLEEAIKAGDKTIVVSKYTSMLDSIESYLMCENIRFLRLDGKLESSERLEIIRRFKDDVDEIPVFLLSSKAGGVGLNLVGGNRMILLEPDWNPSNDLQTMGRIWREGQLKPVYIYRLFSSGTFEEKIYQMQLTKSYLSSSLLDRTKFFSRLSEDELYDMFKLYSTCQSYTDSLIDFGRESGRNSFYEEISKSCDVVISTEMLAETSPRNDFEEDSPIKRLRS